ncbi:MAG: hypothetical protein JXB17_10930, partial [Bacteroidales bacterium]|nr:hypothetical protein [Bacteroidales bacterium]
MKKNRIILLSLLGIIVIGVALIFLIKQKPKKIEVTKIDPGFREYIIGYTGGVIPSKSTIRMRLSAEHKQEVEPNSLIDEKLFKFEPSIKGTTFWIDNQTIEFKPETRLPSGTSYQGEFLLSKIIEVPDKYKTFAFQFQTIKQSFTVTEDNLKTYDKKNLKLYKLEGNVLTADFIENEEIEKILKASQDGKKLSISWDHKPDIKKHLFQVDSINRKAEDGEVIITWDGTPIGVEIKGEKKVEVPGLDNFKLIKVQVIQQPEQHVLLQFSDPLQSNQDLAGLVRIKGES